MIKISGTQKIHKPNSDRNKPKKERDIKTKTIAKRSATIRKAIERACIECKILVKQLLFLTF